jgi:hypothetical protein
MGNTGTTMDLEFFRHGCLRAAVLLITTLTLTACAAPAAKDFGGRWKPVNHYQSAPTEIPLAKAYTFYAAPMDGTLKTMLTRWAKDSGWQLSYLLSSDFALYTPVSQLHTTDVQEAIAKLNTLYAQQDVLISADSRQIQVRSASAARGEATADATISAAPAGEP